jgi:hypothetical protein
VPDITWIEIMDSNKGIDSFYDSPERSSNEEILAEILAFKQNALMNQLLEGFPELAVILNKNRQIVAFNSQALKIFKADSYLDIVGKRVGEAIYCIHHNEMEGGCGTSQFCKECGAAQAIKKSNDLNIPAQNECRIIIKNDDKEFSLDLAVHTNPIEINEKPYTLFAIKDIAHEKRRDALEKIFFHNENVISEQIQLQLFQRSFSTKEKKGRGVGLYSKTYCRAILTRKSLFHFK